MLFANFPNRKFWFPELFSSYAWHGTEIGGSESGIEMSSAQINLKFKIIFTVCCLASWSQQKANMSFTLSDFTASPTQELLD